MCGGHSLTGLICGSTFEGALASADAAALELAFCLINRVLSSSAAWWSFRLHSVK